MTGYNADSLAAYRSAVSNAADGDLDTLAKIQAMIDLVAQVSAISQIDGVAFEGDPTNITEAVLVAAGVTGCVCGSNAGYNPDRLSAYQTAISNADDGELDTLAKIQAIMDQVNAIATIEGVQKGGGMYSTDKITEKVLRDAGVPKQTPYYEKNSWYNNDEGSNDDGSLAAYKTAISNADDGDLDTLAKIQAMIEQVNAIRTIEHVKQNSNPVDATEAVFTAAGVTGYKTASGPAYRRLVSNAADGELDTLAKIQTIIIDYVNYAPAPQPPPPPRS